MASMTAPFHRNSPTALLTGAIAVGILALASCSSFEPKIFSNAEGPAAAGTEPKPAKDTKGAKGASAPKDSGPQTPAVLRARGYRFWLVSEEKRKEDGTLLKEKYDVLKLRPAAYMIGFIQLHPQEGGAAYCELEAGQTYSFEVTGREYMPRSGSYVLKGRCIADKAEAKK